MKRILSLTLAIGFASTGFAGNEHGNGGSVILCPKFPLGKKAELYDFYEGRKRDLSVDLSVDSLEYKEKIEYALDRLAYLNPSRAGLYRKWFREFLDPNVTEFTEDDLVEIPDIGAGTIPKGCKLKQAAAQRKTPLPGDKRYLVDAKIWKILDENNKAGLVLHELVYRESVLLGHEDSAAARYLNSFLASDRIVTMTPVQMHDLLLPLGFRTFDAQGGHRLVVSAETEFYPSGLVKEGRADGGYAFVGSPEGFEGPVSVEILGRPINVNGNIRFHANGNLAEVQPIEFDTDKYGSTVIFRIVCPRFTSDAIESGTVLFDEGGRATEISEAWYINLKEADGTYTGYFGPGATPGDFKRVARVPFSADGCPELSGLVPLKKGPFDLVH